MNNLEYLQMLNMQPPAQQGGTNNLNVWPNIVAQTNSESPDLFGQHPIQQGAMEGAQTAAMLRAELMQEIRDQRVAKEKEEAAKGWGPRIMRGLTGALQDVVISQMRNSQTPAMRNYGDAQRYSQEQDEIDIGRKLHEKGMRQQYMDSLAGRLEQAAAREQLRLHQERQDLLGAATLRESGRHHKAVEEYERPHKNLLNKKLELENRLLDEDVKGFHATEEAKAQLRKEFPGEENQQWIDEVVSMQDPRVHKTERKQRMDELRDETTNFIVAQNMAKVMNGIQQLSKNYPGMSTSLVGILEESKGDVHGLRSGLTRLAQDTKNPKERAAIEQFQSLTKELLTTELGKVSARAVTRYYENVLMDALSQYKNRPEAINFATYRANEKAHYLAPRDKIVRKLMSMRAHVPPQPLEEEDINSYANYLNKQHSAPSSGLSPEEKNELENLERRAKELEEGRH